MLNKWIHFIYGPKHIIYHVCAMVIYRKVPGMYVSPIDLYMIPK